MIQPIELKSVVCVKKKRHKEIEKMLRNSGAK